MSRNGLFRREQFLVLMALTTDRFLLVIQEELISGCMGLMAALTCLRFEWRMQVLKLEFRLLVGMAGKTQLTLRLRQLRLGAGHRRLMACLTIGPG